MSQATVELDDLRQVDLRQLADEFLERTRVEYVDEGVLLLMNPPGFQHRRIVRSIVAGITRGDDRSAEPVGWLAYGEDFQWELADEIGRFYVPDVAVVHPDAKTAEDEQAAIALIAEVTSPTSPDTVLNDRSTKPRQYAAAGVPLYLLVDQERAGWTLYGLAEGWQQYQVAADGKYGEPVPLPPPFGFAIETGDWPGYRS